MKLDPLRDLAFIALTLAGREPRRPIWTDAELYAAEAEVGIEDPAKPIPPPTPPPPPRKKELFYPPILERIEYQQYAFSASSSVSFAPGQRWPVENVNSIRLRKVGE